MSAQPLDEPLLSPPRFLTVPPRDGSRLRAVETQVAAKLGRTLDPAQRVAVDAITSARADGRPATLEAALICPRQNLKTYCLQLVALEALLRPVGGARLAVWSAHEVSTAEETFDLFAELAESEDHRGRPLYPWFARQVLSISHSTGRQSITFGVRLPSGRIERRRLKFRARVKTGGRGLAADLVVLDEAFALQPEHMGSLIPTLSTRPLAQVLYGSSAPLAASGTLRSLMERGRAGGKRAPAYAEWSVPGSLAEPGCVEGADCRHAPDTPGCTLDDETLWPTANPAAAYGRITMEYLRNERMALPAEEWARERYGWGDDPANGMTLTPETWKGCADRASKPQPRPAGIGLDTSKGLRSAVVVVCGVRPDGRRHVEVLRTDAGIEWLAAFLRPLAAKLRSPVRVLGGSSTAQAVIPALAKLHVPVEETSAADYAAACGLLVKDVTDDKLRHLGDPILQRAVDVVATVKVSDGGAFRWSPEKSGGDITALVAATLARWQLEHAPGAASSVY